MRRHRSSMPDYGIDAPYTGIKIAAVTLVAIIVAVSLRVSGNATAISAANILFSLIPTGIIILALAAMYVRVEKFRHRDRMLNMLQWKGNETVLDVGTGLGLLMIGAAKRLTTGKSIGIDIWNAKDLSNNNYIAAMANAKLEEVKDRITILNANAQDMPLADGTFDYVLSNLCLHNIPTLEGRAKAIHEIVRVLKPGGIALISDFKHTKEYAAEFKRLGLETRRKYSFLIAPLFLHVVRAGKVN